MSDQAELSFDGNQGNDGVTHWHKQRERSLRALAHRLGLPLGHEVEIWLKGNVRLRGKLELAEQLLFVENIVEKDLMLRVGRATFPYGDFESCVRTD
jgi:small nuclear ribonucleoprotein (snRNP)-like protein